MKDRLDAVLVARGLFPSREKAKGAIMAGVVFVNGLRCDKAGTNIDTEADIFIKENACPYVSRGGMKLEKAIRTFDLSLGGKIAMDIGASTGGFTDCMLQNGCEKVYCIDVGYGQLDWKLRNDARIINFEKTNIRLLDVDLIPDPIDFISIDVSFISLKLVFPVAVKLLKEDGLLVCLIKPQFEAGRQQVGKKGIVKDKNVHIEVIENVIEYAINTGLRLCDLTYSPMTGAKGNIEYLALFQKSGDTSSYTGSAASVVEQSHEELGR